MEARKHKTVRPLERNAWKAEHERIEGRSRRARSEEARARSRCWRSCRSTAATSQDPRMQQQLDKWKDTLARDLWVDETTRILADMKKAH